MPSRIAALLPKLVQALAKLFGVFKRAKVEQKRTKGLEAQNAILEAEIERGDRTEEIYNKTLEEDEEGLPSFNYSNLDN